MTKKILMVVSNVSEINTETKTGVWFEEFAVPYLGFEHNDFEILVSSLKGGVAPVDADSYDCSSPTEWDTTKIHLDNTVMLKDVKHEDYDAIVFPGGHAPMFDLAESDYLADIVSYFYKTGRLVAAICHGPAALINARKENGEPLVKGLRLTSFTNMEEHIVHKDELMPFMLQTKLVSLGARFVEEKPWSEHVEVDGNLITAQNQKSAYVFTDAIIDWFKK